MQKAFKVWVLVFAILLFSCERSTIANSGYSATTEKNFLSELENELPDFSSPQVEDPNCFVENMPEKVVWFTSRPKDLSSKDTLVGGTIHIPIEKYPTSLRTMGADVDYETIHLIDNNATLLSLNPETNEFMPYAATHWAFGQDGKTIYFKLHENATWSDGMAVTAEDFVFASESDYTQADLEAYSLEGLDTTYDFLDIQRVSTFCISVQVKSDDLELPEVLLLTMSSFSPRPRHFYQNRNLVTDADTPEPTTGPYAINSRETIKDSVLVFDRVSDWWARSYEHLNKTANISRIEYVVIPTTNEANSYDQNVRKAFYNATIDMYTYNNTTSWDEAFINPNVVNGYITQYVLNYIPSTGSHGIFLNTKSQLFSDKSMRQGIFYALDVKGLVKNMLHDRYVRVHTIGVGNIWNNIEFNDYTIRKPDFWTREARSVFNAHGYVSTDKDGILKRQDGTRLSFELVYSDKQNTKELTFLKSQAKLCGLEIILKQVENYYEDENLLSNYDAIFTEIPNIFPPPDHSSFFSRDTAMNFDINNLSQYWSPEMEELLEQEKNATSIEELSQICKKIERLVNEEALIIPFYVSQTEYLGAWQWVRFPAWGNRRNTEIDFSPYGYLWIDDTIKLETLTAKKENKKGIVRLYNLSKRYREMLYHQEN